MVAFSAFLPHVALRPLHLQLQLLLLHLPLQSRLRTELLIQIVRVVLREVRVEIGHDVRVDDPHVVVEGLLFLQPNEFLLDYLSCLRVEHAFQHFVGEKLAVLGTVESSGVQSHRGYGQDHTGFQLNNLQLGAIVFDLLVVLNRRKGGYFGPGKRSSRIEAHLLAVKLLIDDVLLVGHIVKPRTGELEVAVGGAELAGVHLELIGNIADLIPQKAEELVVHVALPKDLDKTVVAQSEQH